MKIKMFTKEIYIPEMKEFTARYPQFAGLAKGEGKFLFDIVMKPETFIQAMILTEYGMPAVTSVAELCYNEAKKRKTFKFTPRVKQFIGAMVGLLMSANGYVKTGRKKSIIHRAYTRGEFYVKK
ncbi:MAG: hypothetical protein KJN64_11970 [Ignavibacteria bacterium]|nr:hypothetical protein [Ignavibacteria bacterium]MBT8383528.1 hypothetical protein [Ignavibacteria bacterium]MBT8391343.1 hypothetical protein [Ignavibacteria bacterium]NNJ52575.1 hypothetical protein [Ignavibacteriaceae bacterium]NNL20030.1 hypothetical protein [Ignavibacteriaceae bacterium]